MVNDARPVLTTGANSGLGLAIAVELARRGFRSIGSVRSEAKAAVVHEAADEAGVEVETVLLDVTDADGCAEVVDSVRPWGLVNNAGVVDQRLVEEDTDDEARAMFETMAIAPMRLARLALPHMRAGGGGRTRLAVELQAREPVRSDALEVSPQQPVVDDGNRTAWLVLKNLAGGRQLPSNLFFFHGPSGTGKTFLLRWWSERDAAARSGGRRAPRLLWFELPALLKAFQAAHQENRVAGLHDELVQDLPLVLDEFHRIAGKPKLQLFVLGVLRARDALSSPTILASRWHPNDVRDLDRTLATSCVAGFVAAVERPGPLGRLRYLRALEGAPSRNGRAAAVETLAQSCVGGYPELRAAWAASRGTALPPKYLELIDPARVFARLRDQVASKCAVPAQELPGKRQGRTISRARKVLAYLCLQNGLSGSEVGRFLGGRTRAAVSYMALSLQAELATSAELRTLLEELA
jgi:chromosomal replication initiation ATPase DnaA